MEKLYEEYGQAVFQVKIWNGKVAQLEKAIQEKMNKPEDKKEEPKEE